MSPDLAKLAMQFLARCQLTGQEVPAFNAVMTAMAELAEPAADEPDEG